MADDLDKPLDGVLPWESEPGLPHIKDRMTNAKPCVYHSGLVSQGDLTRFLRAELHPCQPHSSQPMGSGPEFCPSPEEVSPGGSKVVFYKGHLSMFSRQKPSSPFTDASNTSVLKVKRRTLRMELVYDPLRRLN